MILFLGVNILIIFILIIIAIIINREKILRKFFPCDIIGHKYKRNGDYVKAGVTRRDFICRYCGKETSIISDFPGNF